MDVEVVRAWIDQDPDPRTADELGTLLERVSTGGPDAEEARAELEDRFSGPLAFGTAGLRGALGAGPTRMNLAVVIRAAVGVAEWVRDEWPADEGQRDPGDRPARVGIAAMSGRAAVMSVCTDASCSDD